jgi:F0F1-type ATP synthase gamma subunit
MITATDSATELAGALLDTTGTSATITNEMLDIAGGAEALSKSLE